MEGSFTLILSGTSSTLQAQAPIELSPNKNYVLGLVELLSFNSIPNIDTGKNKFHVGNEVIVLPTGSYEIEDIERYLQEALALKGITLNIKPNNNILCSVIMCCQDIDFRRQDSIARLLGFTERELPRNTTHSSELPVAILKVNVLRVECNITSGAYINERKVHTIHEFFPAVPPGYEIIEIPSQVIYLPIAVKVIDNVQLRILGQDDELVNFRGEIITIRLHIKETLS